MVKSTAFALLVGILVCAGAFAEPAEVRAEDPTDPTEPAEEAVVDLQEGWRYYQRYCQNCHGEEGKGDGRIAHMLEDKPSDLTLLSERNDDVFPQESVAQTIDGRVEGNIHGRREMPVWGNVFREAEEIGDDEEAVHQKILELTAIVKSLDRSVQETGTP